MDGHAAPCNPISCHSKKCQRVDRNSSSAETRGAAQRQDEMDYVRLIWYELEHGTVDKRRQDQQVIPAPRASSTPKECV